MTPPPPDTHFQQHAINISLGVAVAMLVGKISAAVMTGSDAIFSDAAESVIHIMATGIAALSLRIASRPADQDHPYGQGKISYFSAGAEGMLIILAAISIFISAGRSLILGPQMQSLGVGLLITAALGIVNLGLGLYLIRTGRRHRSMILVANGEHVMTDMWTSAAVVGGVAVVWLTDVLWLDPVVAIAAAANIVRTGSGLVRDAFKGLMEVADPRDTEDIIAVLDGATGESLITSYHQVRHRMVGDELWMEMHLLFPDDLTIAEAHRRASVVELRIAQRLKERTLHIVTHLEPNSHDGHPDGHKAES